ncbi:MAG: hypothetical protein ACRDJC_24140, partial [Thermomicrobiales bacterium]
EDAFLVADMAFQPFAELAQIGRGRVGTGGQVLRSPAQMNVLDQHPDDRRVIRLSMARIRR